LSIVFGIYYDQLSLCPDDALLHIYFIGHWVLLLTLVILSAVIAWSSAAGTLSDSTPRRSRMPPLIISRTVLVLPDIAWTSVGTTWAFGTSSTASCPASIVRSVRVAVITEWVLLFVLAIALLVVFDPLGRRRRQLDRLRKRRAVAGGSDTDGDAESTQSLEALIVDLKRLWKKRYCWLNCRAEFTVRND
jgi:hypothetical protein